MNVRACLPGVESVLVMRFAGKIYALVLCSRNQAAPLVCKSICYQSARSRSLNRPSSLLSVYEKTIITGQGRQSMCPVIIYGEVSNTTSFTQY